MHKLKKSHIHLTNAQRLHGIATPLIALTGSIATGKSTASKYLSDKGFHLIDADKLVKSIYAQSETLSFIQKICPESVEQSQIDFKKLREYFFADKALQTSIENYIYAKLPVEFLKAASQLDLAECDFIFYDIPLLFEKDLASKFDLSVLIYTAPSIQSQRLMERDQLALHQADKIIQAQMPIDEKKQLADFIIDNSGDLQNLHENIEHFLSKILQ